MARNELKISNKKSTVRLSDVVHCNRTANEMACRERTLLAGSFVPSQLYSLLCPREPVVNNWNRIRVVWQWIELSRCVPFFDMPFAVKPG